MVLQSICAPMHWIVLAIESNIVRSGKEPPVETQLECSNSKYTTWVSVLHVPRHYLLVYQLLIRNDPPALVIPIFAIITARSHREPGAIFELACTAGIAGILVACRQAFITVIAHIARAIALSLSLYHRAGRSVFKELAFLGELGGRGSCE